ncbi:MAG TPA: hypothetical protein ENH55_02045 [Aurantimonas coralicida]|uniref:Right handed beta helix domain-containing protein n=1 Tax=marine sediment metagenome TaxID=412755 RepID=A0A0F9R2Q0_9ZZZZ|nr:hypothetical protein [Phycisphaerae bacterium]HDZ71582.1 hypothetical protein [Aurantimonas coralicida]
MSGSITRRIRTWAAALVAVAGTAAMQANADTLYVNDATGNDAWDGRCEIWNGGTCGPKKTIQFALFIASNGDQIIVADGVYTGEWNRDIDFGGLAVQLHSASGPANCIIDCELTSRAFQFRFGETPNTVVEGFTIRNGFPDAGLRNGGAILCTGGSSPTIRNCVMEDNSAQRGGALACDDSSPVVESCVFRDNIAAEGGAYFGAASDTTFRDCTFTANEATGLNGGGAILTLQTDGLSVVRCAFLDNISAGNGGAVSSSLTLFHNSVPVFESCLFGGNVTQGLGGAMFHSGGADLRNLTFSMNSAIQGGGAAYIRSGVDSPSITNSIVWGDTDPAIVISGGELSIDYSDIDGGFARIEILNGGTLNWGAGNIVIDPAFNDPANGDFHLTGNSPCIDAADNTAVPAGTVTDLDGNPRFVDDPNTPDTGNPDPNFPERGIVDMGAYEFQVGGCPGDLDGDGDTDLADLGILLSDFGCPAPGNPAPCEGDLDNDGDTDLADLGILLADFGCGAP